MDPSDILHLQIDQLLQGLVGQVYSRETLKAKITFEKTLRLIEDRLLIKIRQTRKLSKQNIASEKWF